MLSTTSVKAICCYNIFIYFALFLDYAYYLWYNNYGTSCTRRAPYGGGCFPYGNADSFCLPERGGDADVRYMGIAVPARRIHNSTSYLHRQS